jgi:hypothetical protein
MGSNKWLSMGFTHTPTATRNSQLGILKWAHTSGCPMESSTCADAIGMVHLEVQSKGPMQMTVYGEHIHVPMLLGMDTWRP